MTDALLSMRFFLTFALIFAEFISQNDALVLTTLQQSATSSIPITVGGGGMVCFCSLHSHALNDDMQRHGRNVSYVS